MSRQQEEEVPASAALLPGWSLFRAGGKEPAPLLSRDRDAPGRLPACPGLLLGARERAAASRPLPRDSPWCCRLSASGRAWELGPSFLQRAAHSVQPVPVTCDVLPPIGHTSAVGSVPLGTAACMACPARLRPHLHQACTPPLLAISWGHDVPTLAVDELELICGSHRPVQPCRGRCGCLHEAGTSRLRSLSLTGHEE